MITTNTLVRTEDPYRYLEADFTEEEPLVLQLGGSCTDGMKKASEMAAKIGYKEININAGCPSEKVSGAGCFGAALMLQPDLLSELALSVGEGLGRPATIKCRIGVDDEDSYEGLVKFIRHVSEKGHVKHFIVHARKAVLNKKFSPDQNRRIPALKYEYVYNLIKEFPHLQFTINGGINTYEDVSRHIEQGVHGVMVGRAIVNSPFYWKNLDSVYYKKDNPDMNRREILENYATYCRKVENKDGNRCRPALIKPILQMFAGENNGRLYRQRIDTLLRNKEVPIGDSILEASNVLREDILDERASSPPPVFTPSPFAREKEAAEAKSATALFQENAKEFENQNVEIA
eukprot:CAMPEP_0119051404 /NCGR_PEP_ID=MMETSP1177-20130426/73030_1 /TAXON_ID=2985 /ORGANISM="Ochromonas sp, Strain CCMP1899" /LENGTH=345 /DNA_ID=CAMNT_0007030591 /DNA_START=381 /DNA_END=1418 /DNA_ORIENTATION=+